MSGMEITPERDPDEDAMWPHFDEEFAEYVDVHGPAFIPPLFDEESPDG